MNPKELKELKEYVLTTKGLLNDICNRASRKRSTDKWKSCLQCCKMLLLRIESTHGCLTSWGNGDDMAVGDILFLQAMYNPFIKFWTGELNK